MPDTPIWEWNPKTKEYENTQTGTKVTPKELFDLRQQFVDSQKSVLDGMSEKLRKGNITLEQYETAVKDSIRKTYNVMYCAGAGGRNNMTPSDWGKIGAMLKDQYGQNGFLKGFMEQIASGNLSQAQINARMNLYLKSADEALWKGMTKELPVRLPAYPGDGSTSCMVNCMCSWFIAPVEGGYDCYWRLGQAEHCPDCMRRASDWAPYRIRVSGGE